jgi:phosphoserine phosphatase RsbU/P
MEVPPGSWPEEGRRPDVAYDSASSIATAFAQIVCDTIFILDAEGRIVYANAAAERMFGWPLEELRGQTLHARLHSQKLDGSELPSAGCAVCAGSRQVKAHHDWFVHRDGHLVPVLCTSSPIAAAGVTSAKAIALHDMSTRKEIQEERARHDFEQQLIGIVSHDLRNPLQAIALSAALGVQAAPDARQQRGFERIRRASDRALRMIDDLLDFSRARLGGGIHLQPQPMDFHALTAQVIEDVLITFPERRVSRWADGDGRGTWDADRLVQVVQNLVGNALQHTTEDTLVSVHTHGEPDKLVLEVHNEGEPIAPDDLPHLFEPFRRGRDARGGRSTGLGLFITCHIVRAHGGTLDVHSGSGEGTTFTVRLPREGLR